MNIERKRELVEQQIAAAKQGQPDNFDEWRNKTEVVLRNVLGQESPLYMTFKQVRYAPTAWVSGMDTSGYRPAGVRKAITILESAKLELDLAAEVNAVVRGEEAEGADRGGSIFIVHGHDDARKHELARFLGRLTRAEPIILHEQPSRGQVLLEKFESSAASVGFAVVLMTGDDLGRAKASSVDTSRARQNVVFELGFFCGAFGRARTAVLYEDGIEMPTDLGGLVYIPLDVAGAWKTALAREIETAAIEVDWTALR